MRGQMENPNPWMRNKATQLIMGPRANTETKVKAGGNNTAGRWPRAGISVDA